MTIANASDPIPVGVVGVRHLGRHHAPLYAGLPRAKLVAVADRDLERARAVATEYGALAVDSVEGLLGKVRAASVAVTTVHHRAVAERLLREGIDVLIEKPIPQPRRISRLLEGRAREPAKPH